MKLQIDWRSLPSLNALRAFSAVAESGGFTDAGAALNVSHAAVSQQVRALEERLGAHLVRREGRGVVLTREGKQLADALFPALQAIARAVNELTGADATRPLQITTTPSFAASWLMPRLSEFRHLHPGVPVILDPSPDVMEMAPGGIDVAIRFGRGDWPGVDAAMLVPSSLVVVAARSLIGSRRITEPREILEFPWLQELGTSEMSNWLRSRGVIAPDQGNVAHLPGHLVMQALRNGDGVTVGARAVVAPEIDEGRLVVLFEEKTPGQGYYVVTRTGVHRPPLKAFLAWLRRHAVREEEE